MSGDEPVEVMSASDAKERLKGALLRQFNSDEVATEAFIALQIKRLLQEIDNLVVSPVEAEQDEGLMERLIQSGLFPSFSFPLDVATFEAAGTKKRAGKSKAEPYIFARTGQDLKVALSEFQPGKRLTINKQTFLVEGVGVSFPDNPISHLEKFEFSHPRNDAERPETLYRGAKGWEFFHRCIEKQCNYIIASTDPKWNLDGEKTCPNCTAIGNSSGKLKSTRIFRPEVFRPKIIPYMPETNRFIHQLDDAWQNWNKREMRAQEDSDENSKPTRLGRPSLPTPLTDRIEDEGFTQIEFDSSWKGISAYRFDEATQKMKLLSDGKLEDKKNARLLLVNSGPNGDGFVICSKCGYVHLHGDLKPRHHRPYAIERAKVNMFARRQIGKEIEMLQEDINGQDDEELRAELKIELKDKKDNMEQSILELSNNLWSVASLTCSGDFTSMEMGTNICLGMTFRTDIFLLRIEIQPPITHAADQKTFDAAFRAIKEALITEATEELELVNREISGNLRSVVVANDDEGSNSSRYVDLYLFDNASGGAGLVREITSENIMNILEKVKVRLSGEKCVDGPCSRVCIGCLLDFRNQMEADRLDRRLGFQILSYLSGDVDTIDFRVTDFNGTDTDLLEREIKYISDIYPHLTLTVTGEYTVEVDTGLPGGKRHLHVHSALESYQQHPENVVIYTDTPESLDELETTLITIPYEVIRDSPHKLVQACYPQFEEDEESFLQPPDF
jgi:hypothetical protein